MRMNLPALALLLASLGLAGCGDDASSSLTLAGSSTVAPLADEIGKRFESEHPGVEINVQAGGSSRGIADARRGLVDIGTASRALAPSESDLVAHTIALDGIALIVHEDNPVSSLTQAQVRDLYTGAVGKWAAVGGEQAPVTVVNKAEGRATLAVFLEHFDLAGPDIQADVVVGHNQQAIKTVAGNRHAIAYVSIGTAEYEAAHGSPIRLLALDGAAATSENVRGGRYPLVRELNLVTRPNPSGLAKAFIDYARSPAVQDLIKQLHFIPAG
ncbi:phosphate ABC transporter substrate-binding protein [Salinisphaera sp. PC39]|uniref:phosphate ABC transporter substrate-binding protein n=1 Tax=Salinisphaera sp. PC39 TaxID=1304156 RepID=UPI0033407553